jgi:hypothetical protein
LIDSTLTLTPPGKFNAYINYDYGQNRDALAAQGDKALNHWQGIAGAAHIQATGTQAVALRYEWFNDPNGFQTGTKQHVQEFTFTYEYKWAAGLLTRVEYRGDFSDKQFFNKLANQSADQQQTLTVALIAFFGPKR